MAYRKIFEQLRDEKKKKEEYIANGYPKDFPSYKFCVGEIKGLTCAIEILQETFKKELEDER